MSAISDIIVRSAVSAIILSDSLYLPRIIFWKFSFLKTFFGLPELQPIVSLVELPCKQMHRIGFGFLAKELGCLVWLDWVQSHNILWFHLQVRISANMSRVGEDKVCTVWKSPPSPLAATFWLAVSRKFCKCFQEVKTIVSATSSWEK